jgi:hypothetical protein
VAPTPPPQQHVVVVDEQQQQQARNGGGSGGGGTSSGPSSARPSVAMSAMATATRVAAASIGSGGRVSAPTGIDFKCLYFFLLDPQGFIRAIF